MARFRNARWRPLPENATQARIRPTQLILHSICGSDEGAYQHFLRSSNLESHFLLDYDGTAEQAVDTEVRADANYRANRRPDGTGAVSVETESRVDASDPWTPAQLAWIKQTILLMHQVHGMPLRVCRSPGDPGVGYHTMFGAPSAWTPVAKSCPGAARVRQFRTVIVPWLASVRAGRPAPVRPKPAVPAVKPTVNEVKSMPYLIRKGAGQEVYATDLVSKSLKLANSAELEDWQRVYLAAHGKRAPITQVPESSRLLKLGSGV